ncbi:MAG: MATE family efflux transporter [Candidatus Aminicenantes bacterium]|nr:MATE family efflux transporter [Candidatus Aminicenantes bacterium]
MKNRLEEFAAAPRRALVSLSLPIAVAMFVQTMYNIVDTAFVGRLGAEAIAALSFSFPVFFILVALTQGIGTGLNSTISRFLGAGRTEDAEKAAANGFFLSLIFAVLTFLLGLITLRPLFSLFGASAHVQELAYSYMSIICLGTIVMFPAFALHSIFAAQGDTRTPMKVQTAGLMLNAVLDPIFIYPLKFGVAGAAIATDISLLVTLILYLLCVRARSRLKLRLKSFKPSPPMMADILRVGAPAGLMMLMLSVYVMFLNGYMVHFGTAYVAAFGLATRLESFVSLPIAALSLALLTLVGMFTGARRFELLKRLCREGLLAGIVLTSAIGLVFFLAPSLFLGIFTPDKDILRIGSAYLRLDVFTFPLMSTTMIIARIMQGMGYGTPGLVINLIRVFGVAVPLAYVFVFLLGFGYLSVAVAMILGGLASNLIGFLWLQKKLSRLDPPRV